MIFSPQRPQRRRPVSILLSLAGHAALLLIAFLLTLHWGRVRPIYRDSRCCTAQLYWTGNTGVSDSSPASPDRHAIPSPIPVPTKSLIQNPVRLRQPACTAAPRHAGTQPSRPFRHAVAPTATNRRHGQRYRRRGTRLPDILPASAGHRPLPAARR